MGSVGNYVTENMNKVTDKIKVILDKLDILLDLQTNPLLKTISSAI